jgi:CRISPR-associated protein Csx10
MKRYRIKASLESPLVIRRERQSQRSEGAQSISGTLLRGALARAYLQNHGEVDATFQLLFLNENACRFGPLDPAERVFPLTANSCKRVPGFTEDDRHGMVDLLPALLQRRLSGHTWPHECCRSCKQELKAHSGFWEMKADRPTEPGRRWRRSMAAHVGIDRHTQTAAESILFNLPAVEPEPPTDGQAVFLTGWLDTEEDSLQALRKLLAKDNILRVGHARTRGYGRVRLTIAEEVTTASGDWDGWSKAMLSITAPRLPERDRYFLFTLSLPTGAVLVDHLLRYTLDPAGMVAWLPALPPADATLLTFDTEGKEMDGGRLWCVTAMAHHERLRGWNAAHGLPRLDEWAVSRGSVYAYLYRGDDHGRASLQDRLRQLQREGIGARRNEGFGRVLICDDFHTRFTPKEAS